MRIGVTGISGRMGAAILESIINSKAKGYDVVLAGAYQYVGGSLVGQDAGIACGLGELGVDISGEINCSEIDVLIDFSTIDASIKNMALCKESKTPIILGVTGYSEEQKQVISDTAKDTAVVFAPNMSVGVNLAFHVLDLVARVIGDDNDIEIIEGHHRHKVDAPSGTAVKMGEVVADALGRTLEDCAIYGREGHTGARDDKTIGFSTIRAGSIVGDHTVMFANEGERFEITHKAENRMTFANGAVRAAKWIEGKSVGLYDMQDVLGLK